MERNQTPFLLGNSQTPIPILYWGIIFLLTVAFSFFPLLSFFSEISKHSGMNSSLLFLGSIFLGSIIVGSFPKTYYRVHNWERGGRVYDSLGVRYFAFLVPNGKGINRFVRHIQPDYRVVRTRRTIADLETKTIEAEVFHMACLIAICPSAIYAVLQGWTAYGLMLTLPNIPLHVYPILLQRYTRARIERLRKHLHPQ